jgi:hypothetical protein
VKAIAAILFAFFLVWQPLRATPANANCCGVAVVACVSCCCAPKSPEAPKPAAPVPTRPATQESVTLLLPTVAGEILLERSSPNFSFPDAEPSFSAGAVPLFQRDCALLI